MMPTTPTSATSRRRLENAFRNVAGVDGKHRDPSRDVMVRLRTYVGSTEFTPQTLRPTKHSELRAYTVGMDPEFHGPVASSRHFAIFALWCVGFTGLGIWGQFQSHGVPLDLGHRSIVPLYLSTIIGEWMLLLFVWRGMLASGNDPRILVSRGASFASVVVDIAIGLAFGTALLYIDAGITSFHTSRNATSVDALLPRDALEIALWFGVSITAGITEEIVYRGYLFGQLASRLRNVPAAIMLQALWFGAMHAYEGLRDILSIAILALAFGLMALARRQCRANIVAHTLFDLIEGIAPRIIRF